jgi:hypothetical protein
MARNKKVAKPPKFNPKSTAILLIVVALIVGGFYIKNYLDQKQLEDNFAVLEQDITELQNNIEAEIPSAKLEREKYCYRESFKYKEGPLKCSYDSRINILKSDTKKTYELIENNLGNIKHGTNDVRDYNYKHPRLFCRSIESSAKDDIQRASILLYCNSLSDRSFYPYKENRTNF